MTRSAGDHRAAVRSSADRGAVTRRIFDAFDLAVAIETHDPHLYALLDDRLPSFSVGSSLGRVDLRYRVLRAGGSLVVTRAQRTLRIVQDLEQASDFQPQLARFNACLPGSRFCACWNTATAYDSGRGKR